MKLHLAHGLAVLVGLVSACGTQPGGNPIMETPSSSSSSSSTGGSSSSSGGVHVVRAQANGALTGSDLGAALQWHAYNQDLLDCLAPITVDPPLNYDDPADQAVANQLGMCMRLHAYARVAANSVSLDAIDSAFNVPIDQIPTPALISGGENSQFGLGAVVVFRDGNGNGALDMVTPGARESVDTILGASVAVEEDSTQDMLVVYRSGELSPIWKIFQGMYDCTEEPPQGYSVLKTVIDDVTGLFICSFLTEGVVEVELRNTSAMHSLICLPGGEGPPFRFPDAPLPAGAVAECFGQETVYFTTTPDSVCPIVERYDLIGCSNFSSPQACRASIWDITASPPPWWPCNGSSNGASLYLVDAPGDVTDGQDALFRVDHQGGTATVDPEHLRIDVVVDDTGRTIRLGTESITFQDNDGNLVFSAGDSISVAEMGVNLFGTMTEPGNYQVRVLDVENVPSRQLSEHWWTPRALPAPLGMQLTFAMEDDAAPLTDAPDELFGVRYLAGDLPIPLSDVEVSVAWGCEPPSEFSGAAHLSVVETDGDNIFERGEVLKVRESAEVMGYDFGARYFSNCVTVRVRRGFNYYEGVGGGMWEALTTEFRDDPAPLTTGLDRLFSVQMTSGFVEVDAASLRVTVSRYVSLQGYTELASYTVENGGLVLTDLNGDGKFGNGDSLLVQETTPLADLDVDGQEYWVYLHDGEGYGIAGATWTSGAQ